MSEPKKLALIGLGHVTEYQLQALSMCPHWTLVAACDPRVERKRLLPPDTEFFESASDLLEGVRADVVLVSTPNRLHYEIGRLVLEHGVDLFLEKPCCESKGQMQELVALAESKGVFFGVALHAAHANDLGWFLTNHAQWELDLTNLTSFECGFFDPYVVGSIPSPAAGSLGGSWLDSGINALSVIGSIVPPQTLRVSEARFTAIQLGDCAVPQATVSLIYSDGRHFGRGTIETNWALGLNRKTTQLNFAHLGKEVLLDHSNESVILLERGQILETIDLRNGKPRLVNHYVNVFKNLYEMHLTKRSNLCFSVAIHELLFDAIEMSRLLAGTK